MTTDHRALLIDALVIKGYLPYRAAMLVDEYRDAVSRKAVVDSDHESYRVLADAVSAIIHSESESDNWDGDDSEEYLLCQFLKWLPDMIRHNVAEGLRAGVAEHLDREKSDHGSVDHESELQREAVSAAAEEIDPFERNAAGQWLRKSDGAPVPWPVVKE